MKLQQKHLTAQVRLADELQMKKNSHAGQVFDLTDSEKRVLRAENDTHDRKKGNRWEAVIQLERHQENRHVLPGSFTDHLIL